MRAAVDADHWFPSSAAAAGSGSKLRKSMTTSGSSQQNLLFRKKTTTGKSRVVNLPWPDGRTQNKYRMRTKVAFNASWTTTWIQKRYQLYFFPSTQSWLAGAASRPGAPRNHPQQHDGGGKSGGGGVPLCNTTVFFSSLLRKRDRSRRSHRQHQTHLLEHLWR